MDFIMKLFVKDYDDSENPQVREKSGKVAGFIGIATNLLLFALKFIVGLISNSVSILADAVNNLTDSGSSVIMLVGFKLAGKPADEEHPFGHARIEYLSGIIVSFIVVLLGVQLGISSVGKILTPEETSYSAVAFLALGLSVVFKLWQGLFYRSVGKKIHSEAIAATSRDSINDVISTAVVLLGAGITYFFHVNLDGWMGLLVAVFILVSGVRLIMETGNPLLGLAPDRDLVNTIYTKILAYDGVVGIHDLTVHNYGVGRCFATVHCEVPAQRDILESHDLVDNIERDFLKEMHIHLVIHMDPVVVGDERTDALHKQVRECVAKIYPQVSIHDFRVVWGITHSNVLFDVAAPFSLRDSDETIKNTLAHEVHLLNPTYRAVITIDRESQVIALES